MTAGVESLREAPYQRPQKGNAAQSGRHGRRSQCDAGGGTSQALQGITHTLLGGLALDPTHRDLLANLQLSRLKSGKEVNDPCQALRSSLQDTQDATTLSEVFRRLEESQPQRVKKTSSRLDLTGLIAPEVDPRLLEGEALQDALGELN